MRILTIGCGGIGSFLIAEVCRLIEIEQIDPNTELFVADNDMVEMEQVRYQNFTFEEAGLNKAQALAKRFKRLLYLHPILHGESAAYVAYMELLSLPGKLVANEICEKANPFLSPDLVFER